MIYSETSTSSLNFLTEKRANVLYCQINGICNISTLFVINKTVVNENVTGSITLNGTDIFEWFVDEGEIWNISSSGIYPANLSKNVGIGTSSPAGKLHIDDTNPFCLLVENSGAGGHIFSVDCDNEIVNSSGIYFPDEVGNYWHDGDTFCWGSGGGDKGLNCVAPDGIDLSTGVTVSAGDFDVTNGGVTGNYFNTGTNTPVLGSPENIYFDFESVANKVTVGSTSGVWDILWNTYVTFKDDKAFRFGDNADLTIIQETVGNDNIQMAIRTATSSGHISLMEYSDLADVDRSPLVGTTHPTLRIYSEDATDANDYLDIYHDQYNAVINVSNGFLHIAGNNGTGIGLYVDVNASAENFIERTSVFDKKRGRALSYIKDSNAFFDNGEIKHSEFYGYATFEVVNGSSCKQVIDHLRYCRIEDTDGAYCLSEPPKDMEGWYEDITYKSDCDMMIEEGVALGDEIAVLRQAVYELKTELCKYESYVWC